MRGDQSVLSEWYVDLADRGVACEATIKKPEAPSGASGLRCEIEDPLYITGPLDGVALKYFNGDPTPRVLAGCEMAHALADTADDVRPLGVSAIRHIGTYNCRVISGTSSLSQHSFANAIDIYGFEFTDSRYYTLIDDWEHNTTNPSSAGARFLYDAAQRWHADKIWRIILTPNYNAAHDNHFHIDETPFADFIGASDGFVLAPLDGDCGGPELGEAYVP